MQPLNRLYTLSLGAPETCSRWVPVLLILPPSTVPISEKIDLYENETWIVRAGRIFLSERERFLSKHKSLDLPVFRTIEYGRLSGN